MRRYSSKYKQYEAHSSPKQKSQEFRVASFVLGATAILWSLCSLRLYAAEMGALLQILSEESTKDDTTATATATDATNFSSNAMRDNNDLPPVMRLTQIRETRPVRKVDNQQEYRQVNNCPANSPQNDMQVTLVAQLVVPDTPQIWLVKELCARWQNPIVLSVYFVNQALYEKSSTHVWQELQLACPQAELIFILNDGDTQQETNFYPVSLLRNLALERVKTSHILVSDPDLLPSNHLADDIENALKLRREARQISNMSSSRNNDALVVPVFESHFDDNQQDRFLRNPAGMARTLVPPDLNNLKKCVAARHCDVLKNRDNSAAHASTRSYGWLHEEWYEDVSTSTNETMSSIHKDIKHVPCMESFEYQPYLVLPWCPRNNNDDQTNNNQPTMTYSPYFDERFQGPKYKQIQLVEHLRHLTHDFYVVPKGFLIRPGSADPTPPHDDPNDKKLWEQFQGEIHDKHGHNILFRKCTERQRNAMVKEEQAAKSQPLIIESVIARQHQQVREGFDHNLEFFNTSSPEGSRVHRLSSLGLARVTREVATQEDYRHVNSCPSNLSEDQVQTTLVTQLDTNRLWLAEEICSRWKDPLVILAYFSNETIFSDISDSFRKEMESACPHADLLFVINDSLENVLYPINLLRNLALEAARTSHVLLHDADFLPSEDLANEISGALQLRREARQRSKVLENHDALVVPAFQIEFQPEEQSKLLRNPRNMSHLIPREFSGLQECVNSTTCSVFHEKHCPQGHSSTRTHLWLKEQWYREIADNSDGTPVKDINPVLCLDSRYYEPYLVLPWCPFGQDSPQHIAPSYDERFRGYGMNKIQFIEHIRHLAYEFFVVPKGFLIHAPHSLSTERVAWDQDTDSLRSVNKALYRQFTNEIHGMYGHDNIRFPRCHKVQKESSENKDDAVAPMISMKLKTDFGSTDSQVEIQFFNYSSLKSTYRISALQRSRTARTFWNQEIYRNETSCPVHLNKEDLRTTLVTQMSSHRLWLAKEICSRWKGPMVLLVYFPDNETYSTVAQSLLEDMQSECSHVELVFVVNDSKEDILYPINLLRNLALERVQTSHMLLHDADFLPSAELSTAIESALALRADAGSQLGGARNQDEKDAIVVPAFQFEFEQHDQYDRFLQNPAEMANCIPRDFDALQKCVNDTLCIVFHENHYPQGHSSTRTQLWLEKEWYNEVDTATSDTPVRDLKPVHCLDSDYYEPYLVLPWCGTDKAIPEMVSPLYDERFVGYGMNKNQYFEHVRHLNYDFVILPQGFLIHAPHTLSDERIAWDRNTEFLRRDNKQLFREFTDDVHKRYGHNVKLKKCEYTTWK